VLRCLAASEVLRSRDAALFLCMGGCQLRAFLIRPAIQITRRVIPLKPSCLKPCVQGARSLAMRVAHPGRM